MKYRKWRRDITGLNRINSLSGNTWRQVPEVGIRDQVCLIGSRADQQQCWFPYIYIYIFASLCISFVEVNATCSREFAQGTNAKRIYSQNHAHTMRKEEEEEEEALR